MVKGDLMVVHFLKAFWDGVVLGDVYIGVVGLGYP